MSWVIEAGSSPITEPLYWAREDVDYSWTQHLDKARLYATEDEAERSAARHGFVAPRIRSIGIAG